MDAWSQPVVGRPLSGRAWFFEKLQSWLEHPHSRIWVIEAEPGYGKTRLAQEIALRYPGAVLLGPFDYTPDGESPELVVLDQMEGQPFRWREPALQAVDKLLVFSRPCPELATLRSQTPRWSRFDSLDVENIQDLAAFLADQDDAVRVLREAAGNFGIASLLLGCRDQVETYRCLLQEVEACLIKAPNRDLSTQILTLLGETGGALEVWRICDFLGSSAMRVRHAIAAIEPLLKREGDSYQIYHPWLGRALSWSHFRDLEIIHASIITYFRETYPSWDEMSDSYGWDQLVHHCDRLARTARKRDFSVLHWLGEGPFLRQKLRQGGKLPGVLHDLERCLVAAMEENDLSRIAFYAFQLPRVRQEHLAREMHYLADHGQLPTAQYYAQLFSRENHQLLALVLLAWQAADERKIDLAEQLLAQARSVDSGGFFPEMNLLLVSICACLLKTMPHREQEILELLSRDEQSGRAASNYLTLGLVEGLEDRLRNWVLHRGWSQAPQHAGAEQQRLSTFIGQSLRALKQFELAQMWSGALTKPQLTRDSFDQAMKNALATENEVERLDQVVELADQLSRQQPAEWLGHGVAVITQSLQGFAQPDCSLRGFAQLSRLWLTLGGIPEAFEGLERLAQLARELEMESQLRVRIVADLALGFHRLGDSTRSGQLISKAAAGAIAEDSPERKCAALAFVAAATAQLGHASRSRDLAFTLLESLEPPPGPVQDHFCRLTFRLASSAAGSPEGLRQALGHDQRELVGLGNSPRERAYMLLGLARAAYQSGDSDWSTQLVEQAAAQAYQLVVPKLRAATLSDLACLAWDMGQHDRYRALLAEAREALSSEASVIQRLEGDIEIARAVAYSKDRNARRLHREILEAMKRLDRLELCLSPTLPKLLPLLQEDETRQQAHQLLVGLREKPQDLSKRDADFYQSGLLHLELAFGEFDQALQALNPIQSSQIRSQAMVDLAVGLTARDPREGLSWLQAITRKEDRLRAIRLILAELGAEKRPWRHEACLQALQQITLIAQEDEATIDLVVSYWLTRESDSRKFDSTGKRMGWTPEPSPMVPLHVQSV